MIKKNAKQSLYEFVALVGKAVSSPKRLEILDTLSQGEKTVDAIAKQIGISLKLASAHLQDLKAVSLVESRRDGKCVYYRIPDTDVTTFWVGLRALAEKRLSAMQDILKGFVGEPNTMTPMDRKTLMARAKSGDVIVIDVRPQEEFEAGHFPGARSLPLDQLKKTLKSLPKSKTIVAYCRGPYCLLAEDAVAILQQKGFRATRFPEGVSEWIAAGLPIEKEVMKRKL
ncbi:MAG: ArsR family transcriptional regulator [Bdellovibrionales bacterium GWA2_49_15]|nr:MAG: ArsR family transcriptional regulator [Bdellovibrionales bacterium GWA2_49_15]HAZ13884.1 ArsR family transcriptional regulator [Bdellovibrionales bacterium]